MNNGMDARPAFSFLYNGKDSREFLDKWKQTKERTEDGRDAAVTVIRRRDESTGLEVEVEEKRFSDSPAVEWVMRLRNTGAEDTPILSEIYPLDAAYRKDAADLAQPYKDGVGNPRMCDFNLRYCRGGLAGAADYEPLMQPLGATGAKQFELSAAAGRSSNKHLPFFNLQTGADCGVIAAIGWSGQWHARFDVADDHVLRIRGGMEQTNLRLRPGEEIRTPRIVLLPWTGEVIDGHNLWRRFMRKHHTLALRGEAPFPQTWSNTWFTFNQGCEVNEQNQKESMTGAARMGIETLTVDAGWFEITDNWWDGVGSWVTREDTFPDGFDSVAAHGKREGIDLGIWFEPERVYKGTRLAREHPQWLLSMPDNPDPDHYLLNLGLPEAQEWFIDLVGKYAGQGMRWFRHDFNADPLVFWHGADAPDRQGMTEIRYIEGLYRIYEEIHRRYPDLLIEGCASGGRRIDLETVSRNHGYWGSDMMCGTPEPMQAHIHGYNLYLLPHVHNQVLREQNAPVADTPANRYMFFSFLGAAPCCCFDTRGDAWDYGLGKRWVEAFKSIRHLTMGDYYPLTEYSRSLNVWTGYQFHRDDLNEGLVVVFRRPEAPYEAAGFKLRGLDADTEYVLMNVLDGGEVITGGSDLTERLEVILPNSPDVTIVRYRSR